MSRVREIRWDLVGLLVSLALLCHPPVSPAQVTQVLQPAERIPLHSRVDVSTLPSPPMAVPPGPPALRVKPFWTPDPRGLQKWKESLERAPGAAAPEAGVIADHAWQMAVPVVAPVVSTQFEGLANADNGAIAGARVLPPDNGLGVGPDHVFEMVNIVGRISTRQGEAVSSFSLNSFFAVDSGFGESDPRVIYDASSGRWFATYLEYSNSVSSIILMVSTTSDPTQTFCRYKLGNPTTETFLQDFPMLGVSNDKVVVTHNGFSLTTNLFVGSGMYILNKADLTACATTLHSVRVPPIAWLFTPHPAQSLGSTNDLFIVQRTTRSFLTQIKISGVPGVSSVAATFMSFPIRRWNAPPNALQAGSSVRLDSGDTRVLSVAWQNSVLWLAGNESCTPPGDSATRSCLRLIQVATNTGSVVQDMTLGAAGAYHMYPALRPDGAGNLFVVFTRSSASTFAEVRITGRLATDPVNTLQPSVQIRAGGGPQTDPSGRLGDYSGAAVDPIDSSIVWVSGEYIASTGSANWGTTVAGLRF